MIFNAEHLKQILADIDFTADWVEFTVCDRTNRFAIHTSGPQGDMDVQIPEHSEVIAQNFQVRLLRKPSRPVSRFA